MPESCRWTARGKSSTDPNRSPTADTTGAIAGGIERGLVPSVLSSIYNRSMHRDADTPSADLPHEGNDSRTVDRSSWPVWIGRVGEPEPRADYSHLTPSQRIALCWEATKQAWALTGSEFNESAFRRDSESFSRRGS